MRKGTRGWAIGLLALPFTAYTVFMAGPTLYTFIFSLTNWKALSSERSFIGLEHFRRLLDDSEFWVSLRVTLIWTIAGVAVSVILGFLLALALSAVSRLARLTKSLFFLPLALSLVVVGFTWTWIFRYEDGLINKVVAGIGLESVREAWLTDPKFAIWSIIIAWCWQQVPLSMVVYLAGLTAVPRELLESAMLDGASYWKRVWHVVVPSVRASTIVVVSLALVNSLRSFDIVYVITGGGPYKTTQTLALMSYDQAFKRYDFGYGSAVAVVLFLMTVVIVGGFTWWMSRGEN